MLRLIKVLISACFFAAFVWWGMTVKLGSRTFFGHVYAIGQTKESKDLVRGTKEKVSGVTHLFDTASAAHGASVAPAAERAGEPKVPSGPPQEQLTNADRDEMRRALEAARAPKSR